MSVQYHNAIGTLPHAPALAEFPVATPTPGPGQVLVKAAFIGMTPLAVWQMDYRYMAPAKDKTMLLAGTVAGTVCARGEGVSDALQLGTKIVVSNDVMDVEHLASQEIVLAEQERCMPLPGSFSVEQHGAQQLPGGFSLEQGATLGASVVTAFHILRTELGLHIPLELSSAGDASSATAAVAQEADAPVLVWGGSTSTGFYAIQILKAAGFKMIITTSSPGNHARLEAHGATHTLTFSDANDVADRVASLLEGTPHEHVPFVVDCTSDVATFGPLSRIVGQGSKVAVLTPVRRGAFGATNALVANDEIPKLAKWEEGVELVAVKSFSYAARDLEMGQTLQPKVLPAWLTKGVLVPAPHKVVDGESFLERTAEALSLLREGRVQHEKLLVAVS